LWPGGRIDGFAEEEWEEDINPYKAFRILGPSRPSRKDKSHLKRQRRDKKKN